MHEFDEHVEEATKQFDAVPPGLKALLWHVRHHLGSEGLNKVSDAIVEARANGVDWTSIIGVILTQVLGLLGGKPLDLQAIIAAILALFQPKQEPEA